MFNNFFLTAQSVDFFQNILEQFTSGPERIVIGIVDVLLFSVLMFILFKFLKKNHAQRLILVIIPVLLVSVVLSSSALGFPIMGRIFPYTVLFAVLAVIILFPSEIRRGLWKISSPRELRETFNTAYNVSDEDIKDAIDEMVRAIINMAKKNIGALMIVAPEKLPTHILESGTSVDGKISSSLIETIFHVKTPLHDGAMCIFGNRIIAAGCFLPLSQNNALDKELGTRHRAALGITEIYNVFAVIVSEETGVISTARDGLLTRYYDSVMLTDAFMQVYGLKVTPASSGKRAGRAAKKRKP
ncbi:MAG: diadenylate cyclase [Firmicutes bacterium]|nr:diadenylate cyclase [Bacillota bacterium]